MLYAQVTGLLGVLGGLLLGALPVLEGALPVAKQRAACSMVTELMSCASGLLLRWQPPAVCHGVALGACIMMSGTLLYTASSAATLASSARGGASAELKVVVAAGPGAPEVVLRAVAAAARWMTADCTASLSPDLRSEPGIVQAQWPAFCGAHAHTYNNGAYM